MELKLYDITDEMYLKYINKATRGSKAFKDVIERRKLSALINNCFRTEHIEFYGETEHFFKDFYATTND
jgi:hypothetical protein